MTKLEKGTASKVVKRKKIITRYKKNREVRKQNKNEKMKESEDTEDKWNVENEVIDDLSNEDYIESQSTDSNKDMNDMDFEQKAALFQKRMIQQQELALEETRDAIKDEEKISIFKNIEKAEDDSNVNTENDLKSGIKISTITNEELKDRIQETIQVLSNFSKHREEGRDRSEYVSLLTKDFIEYYEYNAFLMSRIVELFPPREAYEFLESMEIARPTTLRVNTLKAKRRELVLQLNKRGVHVEPLEKWNKVGLQVFDSKVSLGGTLEYLAGHYTIQAAASFLPVTALDPQTNEKILDMAAAPGGKTTYIAQIMKNTGILVANDISEARCKSLNANIQRLGVTNCLVTCYDGIGYKRIMHHFNRVLLDAPCTGTGIISRDKSIKISKEREHIDRITLQQRKLLLSAIDCTINGGVIVYSTCSFLVEENEAIIDFAKNRRDIEIVDIGLPFGRPGYTKYRHHRYSTQIEHCRRVFPHVHNMDGFFIAKIIKKSSKI